MYRLFLWAFAEGGHCRRPPLSICWRYKVRTNVPGLAKPSPNDSKLGLILVERLTAFVFLAQQIYNVRNLRPLGAGQLAK